MTEKELIRLYNTGKPLQQIADRAGLTLGSLNNKLLVLRKAKKIKRRPQTLSKERIAVANKRRAIVKKRRKQGRTNAEISEELGVSEARVQQIAAEFVAAGELEKRYNSHR